MNIATEDISTIHEPTKDVSLQEQILDLGEISITRLSQVLDINTRIMSSYLKTIGRRNNFDDRLEGTIRQITLTSRGVENLLKEHNKRMTPKEVIKKDISPERVEEIGIGFAEFKKLFALKNKAGNANAAWRHLTTYHTYLFGDDSKSTGSLYLLKKGNIETAINLADIHSKGIATQVENRKHSVATGKISNNSKTEGKFICNN